MVPRLSRRATHLQGDDLPYACPRCERLVPDDHVDVSARRLSCESCGVVFEGIAPDAHWRGVLAPPPPFELTGVPASVDVLQPGDGTIEFRIAHLQRLKHGPQAAVWLLWVAGFGVGAAGAFLAERWAIAALCALLALPGVDGLRTILRHARTSTRVSWDRVTGVLRVSTTGGIEHVGRFGGGAGLLVRSCDDGIELVATGEGETRLAIDVPLNATAWVLASMRGLATGG